jgi:hypothetical protein
VPRSTRGYWTGPYADFGEFDFPDVGLLCVIVPIKTENWMHFSARLDNGTPEVRLERAVRI